MIRVAPKIKDYFFLLLVAVIAFWPISFMLFSVKNDAINYFLAMRYNTSEAIQHGYFPSWSAYINMGYPLHADMQSGVWNPFVLLLSLIRTYDIYWLQLETILTIFLSGLSMYHLLKYFKLDRKIVLAVSAAYMMNGYITDAGQFLNWLYAASLLPFVFLCTARCFQSYKWKDAFLLGLAFGLMLLCSYPADFILVSYLVLFFIIAIFIRHAKADGLISSIKKTGKQTAIAGISFLIICLPAILSYIPFIQSIDRGKGVDIQTALSNSLAPANFLSFLYPWATQKGSAFSATDPLIRNCYMGIVLLCFFFLFFLHKREKTFIQKFLTGVFIFFLIFSLGEVGGLRVFLYKFIPLMDTFRHPANAKLFFIFAGQLLAAFALQDYFNSALAQQKKLRAILFLLLSISVLAVCIGLYNSSFLQLFSGRSAGSITDRLKTIKDHLSFYDLLFLNSIIILITLVSFQFLIRKAQLNRYLLPLILVEMFLVAQGMIPLTYARKLSPAVVEQLLQKQPGGYPLPATTKSIADFSIDGEKYFDTIGCLNPYNKEPGRSDYIISPANLSTQRFFWDYVSFRQKIVAFPLVYFADTLYRTADTARFISAAADQKVALIDTIKEKLPADSSGRIRKLAFKKFVPGLIVITAENNNKEFLVLLQNWYPNWKVFVNGQASPMIHTNLSFMGVWLPPGNNEVKFVYQSGTLQYLGLFSVLFIFFMILIPLFQKKYSR